jgi:hypothetical protein
VAIAQIRRKSNNALLCNYIAALEKAERWKGQRPIYFTLAGNTIPGDGGVLEYYYDFTLVFADDDPINTLANYDTLMLDIIRNNHFIYIDENGNPYPILCVSDWPDTSETPLPVGVELEVKATYKIEGFLPT